MIDFDGNAYLVESTKPPERLFLFGTGHVAKETAASSKRAGFRTIVFDDRTEFANANCFPDADEIFVRPECAQVLNGFNTTSNDLIVIVTRRHRFDKEVPAQALQTEAGHIGMIGSRKKRDTIYKDRIIVISTSYMLSDPPLTCMPPKPFLQKKHGLYLAILSALKLKNSTDFAGSGIRP